MSKNDIDPVEMDGDASEVLVYEKTYQALREVATSAGSLVAEGEPQKIPLAYTISRKEHAGRRDFDSAYFAWVAYEANGAGHDAVVEAVKGEDRVIRFLDLRTSKDAAKHAQEMHEFYANMPETPLEAGAEVSDAQLDAALKEAGV